MKHPKVKVVECFKCNVCGAIAETFEGCLDTCSCCESEFTCYDIDVTMVDLYAIENGDGKLYDTEDEALYSHNPESNIEEYFGSEEKYWQWRTK